MKWIAAAILAGALIVSATIALTRASGPEVFETESAIEALSYIEAGWRCEYWGDPLPPEMLDAIAAAETSTGGVLGDSTPEPDFRCTLARAE